MIKIKVLVLIALAFISNGCTPKEKIVIKTEYIKQQKYTFNKVELKGAYIELKDKHTQKLCTPSLLELNTLYKDILYFYDWQIDEYGDKNDTTK